MIYQFLDWRVGIHRQMCVVQVERCFERLRKNNQGKLPYYLRNWEDCQIFAGESGIKLPEMRSVAEHLVSNDSYPSLQWVREQYEKFINFMNSKREYKELLTDPPAPTTIPTIDPAEISAQTAGESSLKKPEDFTTIVEGSTSNTADKSCSEHSQATSSPSSTSTGLPNSSLTGKKLSPQQRRN